MELDERLRMILGEVAEYARGMFAEAEQNRLDITIEIEGRPEGELKITFAAGEYGQDVKGNAIQDVVEEHLRRRGWSKHHNAIALPAA